LAYTFQNVQQAKDFLIQAGGNPQVAQRWDLPGILSYKDTTVDYSKVNLKDHKKKEHLLTEEFTRRMKELLEKTGIEPPLSVEVRIKDRAKIVRESD
jgi:hypothetical protein